MADDTLKLCGEPVVPGMALPRAMERIEKNLELVAKMGRMKGSVEAQLAGLLTVCEEQQQLLKLAFIENGMLASKIEILTSYQADTCRKLERKLAAVELEHKVTKRHLCMLRKRLSENSRMRKAKMAQQWWAVDVSCSDYNSLSMLARSSGLPDLDFMLRLNQLMIDFVKDPNLSEILLPPMGSEERAELSKLASIYRIRCRYNKSTQVASSTLIKARQTCIPGPGEVDSILNSFTIRKQKDMDNVDSTAAGPSSPTTDQHSSPSLQSGDPTITASRKEEHLTSTPTSLPSYMLTPVSSYGTPTITLEMDPQTSLQVYPPDDTKIGAIASENPLDLLPGRMSSGIKITKLDQSPLLTQSALMQVVDSSSSAVGQKTSNVPFPSYPGLLGGTSGLSSQASALQLAIFNQTQQQIRSLGILPTPTSSTAQSGNGPGVPTVVASPLPPSLSTQQQQQKQQQQHQQQQQQEQPQQQQKLQQKHQQQKQQPLLQQKQLHKQQHKQLQQQQKQQQQQQQKQQQQELLQQKQQQQQQKQQEQQLQQKQQQQLLQQKQQQQKQQEQQLQQKQQQQQHQQHKQQQQQQKQQQKQQQQQTSTSSPANTSSSGVKRLQPSSSISTTKRDRDHGSAPKRARWRRNTSTGD